ncbi:MAG: hypothetical protein SF052_00215 [Bacteroidia bacterium]|nr:hypothetical protein [Bacteroidia bacterium]
MCKKILKNIGFVVVVLLATPSLCAQTPNLFFTQTDAWVAGSMEDGTISVSFLYEHKFKIYPSGWISSLGVSSGLTLTSSEDIDRFIRGGFFQLPLYFTLQTGHRSHHAHLAAGARFVLVFEDDYIPPFVPIPMLELSYRFEPPQGGIMLQGGMGISIIGIITSGGVGWAF